MMAERILKRLKFDNDTVQKVCRLVLYHDYGNGMDVDMRMARRAVNRIGEEAFPGIFAVKYADIMAQSDYCHREKLERLEKWRELYGEILAGRQCVSLKTLAVKGSDLIALGWKPGKELGAVLQKLLELVLDDPGRNTREILLAQAEQMKIAGES